MYSELVVWIWFVTVNALTVFAALVSNVPPLCAGMIRRTAGRRP